MRSIFKPLLATALAAFIFFACKKEAQEKRAESALSESELADIKALGFGTADAQKVDGGYLVEGDIFLSPDDLKSRPSSPNMLVAQEEQYRTFNLVSPTEHPTIKVQLSNSSAEHQSAFRRRWTKPSGGTTPKTFVLNFSGFLPERTLPLWLITR